MTKFKLTCAQVTTIIMSTKNQSFFVTIIHSSACMGEWIQNKVASNSLGDQMMNESET